MIKIEDNVSVVLLSAMLVTFLIFGFIHVFTPLATTFWIGLGNEQAPDENLLIMLRNFGWMFLIYAIGLVMVLTSPKDESAVFIRVIVVLQFIMSLRMFFFYAEGTMTDATPVVVSVIGFIVASIVMRRLGLNKGTTI